MDTGIIPVLAKVDEGKFCLLVMTDASGCCEIDLTNECAGLCKLHVNADKRRRGIATRLFESAMVIAKGSNKISLSFTCQKKNTGALQFYKKMGCKIAYDYGSEYMLMKDLES